MTLLDHFPLAEPRKAQKLILEAIENLIASGATDIVVEAPTGVGKTAIGGAVCFYGSKMPEVSYAGAVTQRGGYYLVTQKMLQTQIVEDVNSNFKNKDFGSVKSSAEYTCDNYGNCQIGQLAHIKGGNKCGFCPYKAAKEAFMRSSMALTNYPYFLTEKTFVGELPPRNVIVLDEAHGLAETLLKYGEVVISDKVLKDMGIHSFKIQDSDSKEEFSKWLDTYYIPILIDALEAIKALADGAPSSAQKLSAVQNMLQKVQTCSKSLKDTPEDWAFWIEETEADGKIALCKPLNAAPYMDMIKKGGRIRLYMSAYPGDKTVFCKSLGLDPNAVAWIKTKSAFPAKHRPIIVASIGSMSKKNIDNTLPYTVNAISKILETHKDVKGVIHCATYDIGKKLFSALQGTPQGFRLLFADNAEARDTIMELHCSAHNTVIISPSMMEGYDFADDMARFQILAKVPYMNLGDLAVSTKMNRNPDWYAQQALSSTVQAVGRGVRNAEDYCVNYLLDSDFSNLFTRHSDKLPSWFKDAIVRQ